MEAEEAAPDGTGFCRAAGHGAAVHIVTPMLMAPHDLA
jgi:hypothetical protein